MSLVLSGNARARGLVSRRYYALEIIVPTFDNPFFPEIVSGAEWIAAGEGYAVLLCDARQTSARRHLETLQTRLVDGVVLDASAIGSLPQDEASDLGGEFVAEVQRVFARFGREPGD